MPPKRQTKKSSQEQKEHKLNFINQLFQTITDFFFVLYNRTSINSNTTKTPQRKKSTDEESERKLNFINQPADFSNVNRFFCFSIIEKRQKQVHTISSEDELVVLDRKLVII